MRATAMPRGDGRDLRVLLFSATPRSDRGGIQSVLEAMPTALEALGAVVVRVGPDEVTSPRTVPFELEAGTDAAGRPAIRALPRAGVSLARLVTLLARFRPRVVNLHFVTGAASYFLALRPVFGFRLVLSMHGSDVIRVSSTMRPHLARFLRAADAVTVVSEDLGRRVREIAVPRRLSVIPNGIDTSFWCPPASGTVPLPAGIVAAGRLREVKGFDLLIAAVAGLPDARLTIFGEGPDRDALAALAVRHGTGDRIAMPGHAEPERLRDALRAARVFAQPSRSEGMPLALIEALACGCPAVATQVGGVAEVLTAESGVLVPPGDVAALGAALGGMLAGKGAASRTGARTRAEAFSETAAYSAYHALFSELSGDRVGTGRAP